MPIVVNKKTTSLSNQIYVNTTILANIGSVTAGVIRNIAGNDISTSLNGETLTHNSIAALAIQRASMKLSSN